MTVPDDLLALVERFDSNRDAYLSGKYHETQLRLEFVDPFFQLLGWDIHNKHGYAEAYKDVVHEDAIKIGGWTKAPDYAFRIGGQRKFFVETKAPHKDLKQDPEPAFQLRRYAWSAKLPLSILTDFEEFSVYDTRVRPAKTDKASVARVMYLRYTDYVEKWEELGETFSREALLKGSFDRYVESQKKKRGTAEVDEAFLGEMERWREELAKNLALRNPDLELRPLNTAVQRTIDRIVFLRICEDRGIEQYGQLQALLNGERVYARLGELFLQADERYDSGLFHFRAERGRKEPPDEFTLALTIDDKVLKGIVSHLYYPESPYEFSVLSADILGQVYEQFLGKVIRLTPGHRAKVEERPEVRKAGGVYYTPKYIVDYIIEHTVGKLLEKAKAPKKVEDLKVVDPACGSGSFLIGAYQKLLAWHRDYYVKQGPEKHVKGRNPRLYQGPGGEWRLTTAEKKRILTNNIFGVDIDPQAVEVTKLSLLLKVLEGESSDTLQTQLRLFRERALPDLASNIKCGNSLIGSDFYDDDQMDMLHEEDRYRINVFDWEGEFPGIFRRKSQGFDAVIGNPPWLMAGYYVKDSMEYLKRVFGSATGKFDLYYVFIEKALRLRSPKGFVAMIVPNKFFHTRAAKELRHLLSTQSHIQQVIDFGTAKIFKGATNYSCILVLGRGRSKEVRYVRASRGLTPEHHFSMPVSQLSDSPWVFADSASRDLIQKISGAGVALEDLTERFGTGVQTGSDSILTFEAEWAKNLRLERALLKRLLRGRDVRRYRISTDAKLVLFPYTVSRSRFAIMPERKLQSYKRAYAYLCENQEALSHRVWFGKGPEELSGTWFGFMYCDGKEWFERPHILTPSLSNRANFALGTGDMFVTGTAGVTSIVPKESMVDRILELLAILNSNLTTFWVQTTSPVFSGGYYKFSAPYLQGIPIVLQESPAAIQNAPGSLECLARTSVELREELSRASTEHAQKALRRQIAALDRRIDQMVYELYGLTDREIRIVEEAGAR